MAAVALGTAVAGEPPGTQEAAYWRTSTGVVHNRSCRYYRTTKKGILLSREQAARGRQCKLCGGVGPAKTGKAA